MNINTTIFKEKKKSKITILGDSAYDTANIRKFIKDNNMNAIIDYNKEGVRIEACILFYLFFCNNIRYFFIF